MPRPARPTILVTGATGKLGAAVVAHLFDPEPLLAAMRGAARAYYVAPFDLRRGDPAAAFAAAARAARLEAVVGLSQWLASPAHPSSHTRHHYAPDRLFAALPGVAHTVITPGFFADNYLRPIGPAAQLGVLPSLTATARTRRRPTRTSPARSRAAGAA